MYTPRGIKTNEIQTGGQTATYIDLAALQRSVSTMSIASLSSVKYIMSSANLTTVDALSSITTEQLSSLVVMIDKQIAVDYASIRELETERTCTMTRIDGPYGLYEQYRSISRVYSTALLDYEQKSRDASAQMTQYINDVSGLIILRNQSTTYAQQLKGYKEEYDAILSSLQRNSSTVQMYEEQYRGLLSNISANNVLYIKGSSSLSTISTIVYSDLMALNNPTNINIYPQLSTTYITNLFTYIEVSTSVNNYIISDLAFKSSISTLYRYLYSTLKISSFDFLSSDSYYSTIQYYSGLELKTRSTIDYYNSKVSSLISDIRYLSSLQVRDYGLLVEQTNEIRTQQSNYYRYLKLALEAECDEYRYGIEQYNSQLGYITASLGIIVNNIASRNDAINIRSLDPNIPETTKSADRTNQIRNNTDTRTIIGIINSLNMLDLNFQYIITNIETEKRLKGGFIDARQNILTTYEIPALLFSTQVQLENIRAAYEGAFTTLNDININNINAEISSRITRLGTINQIISPLKANINRYFTQELNISEDQLPDVLTKVLDDTPPIPTPPALPNALGGIAMPFELKEPTSNSIYAFIPPINFNPGFIL